MEKYGSEFRNTILNDRYASLYKISQILYQTIKSYIVMNTTTLPDASKNSKGIGVRMQESISIAIIIVVMVALEIALAYLFNSCSYEPVEYHSWM